ncbi:MAG: aspartate kinase [Deltaproteobacteria bacterium]|nr:aspartate kinase [Deltaproteobacteria bacterium]
MDAQPTRIVVQKYGGSSVADVERLRQVARRIAQARQGGAHVVAVVSAMGKTTDQLVRLAHEVTDTPDRRELDMLLSAGERIAMALLAMAVRAEGLAATSLTGSQCGILTNDSAGNARIVEVRPFRVQDALAQGHVVIVAGFQGTSWRREVTTLGRGGSDTTAVALAAALGADCEIYSDVDGIYSADPRLVTAARRIDALSHDETLALARAGAKVLAADAVALARMHGIALYARRTDGTGGETVVRLDAPRDRPWVSGVAGRPHAVLLRARDAAGAEAMIAALADAHLCPLAVTADAAAADVLVARDVADAVDPAFDRAVAAVEAMPGSIGALRGALASIVGPAVGREPGLITAFREIVRASGAEPLAVVAHGLTLSALVDPMVLTPVLAALHARFVAEGAHA